MSHTKFSFLDIGSLSLYKCFGRMIYKFKMKFNLRLTSEITLHSFCIKNIYSFLILTFTRINLEIILKSFAVDYFEYKTLFLFLCFIRSIPVSINIIMELEMLIYSPEFPFVEAKISTFQF